MLLWLGLGVLAYIMYVATFEYKEIIEIYNKKEVSLGKIFECVGWLIAYSICGPFVFAGMLVLVSISLLIKLIEWGKDINISWKKKE